MSSNGNGARTNQDEYWAANEAYVLRNTEFDTFGGMKAWEKILAGIKSDITTVLDCGANIGRNIGFLKNSEILPNAEYTAIDINEKALEKLSRLYPEVTTLPSNLLELKMESTFDLVFTSGVLIHIKPENLNQIYQNLIRWSNKYCVIIEYFNRTPVEIAYRGESGLLWKRDFGREFLQLSGWELHSYGFLWGYEFDAAGFDDTTYWVFRRK